MQAPLVQLTPEQTQVHPNGRRGFTLNQSNSWDGLVWHRLFSHVIEPKYRKNIQIMQAWLYALQFMQETATSPLTTWRQVQLLLRQHTDDQCHNGQGSLSLSDLVGQPKTKTTKKSHIDVHNGSECASYRKSASLNQSVSIAAAATGADVIPSASNWKKPQGRNWSEPAVHI